MTPETRLGVTVDRCQTCGGLWFDAEELDRWLGQDHASDRRLPEGRIPPRGVGSRPCPRCERALDTAGWTGLVLDRCARCRGLVVEAHEFIQIQREGVPEEAGTFESRLTAVMVEAGWTLLAARALALLVMQFLRR